MPSPWLNSDPEGEVSLFNMDRLMMDCFSPTFSKIFWLEHKKSIKRENFNFLLNFWAHECFLSEMKKGVNIVFTLLLTGKPNWSFVVKLQNAN